MILVDTNIPLRIAKSRSTRWNGSRFGTRNASPSRLNVFTRCNVVCTRPAGANGFGMTTQQACAEIAVTRSLFELLPETAQVYPTWEGLIAKHAIQGKRAHDVRLVALMIQHHVPRILTFPDR
jgi:hypothetical protein